MPLDFNIGSAAVPASLRIDPTTDGDVFAALTANTPFPDRDVQIGRIVASLSIPSVSFTPGAGGYCFYTDRRASFTSGLLIDHDPSHVEVRLCRSTHPSLWIFKMAPTIASSCFRLGTRLPAA